MASSSLNPYLARWIVTDHVSDHPEIDCAACPKARKCCDFQPFVANFLLGAILEQGGELPPSNSGTIWAPIGLVASADFRRQHALEPSPKNLVCAFYDLDQRQCRIWTARPGECSSYLCGTPEMARTQISERAFAVESAVAQMAMVYQGLSAGEIAAQVDILNGSGGRQLNSPPLDFYRRTWAWAKTLGYADIAQWIEQEN